MKRAISLLLSLVMIVSVMVVTPINAGATNTQNDGYSSKIDKDITMTGNNSLGTMLASEFEEDVAEQEGESECGIYGIEMDGTIAYVDIQAFIDATLIVGVFDENTDEMYCSGMVNVGKDDTIVVVKIETDTLPQYYMVKAFLVDRESKTPLCKQYECDTYTTVMQEFLSKTTDDFAEEDVLNLDESEDNNFLVYGEDTIVVDNSDESKNVVQTADEENREYVIENIDDTIASLKEGDIFTYEYGEEGLLIIKVSSITIDGTTATIYGDEITLEEAFDYIKIDTSDYSAEANVDNSNLDEDVEFLGVEEPEVAQTGAKLFDDKLALAASLSYKIKEKKFSENASLSGNLGFKVGLELYCYYDLKLFGKSNLEIGLKVDYELALDITLQFEAKGELHKLKIGRVDFSPMPGVFIGFTPAFIVEGEVSAQLNGTLTGHIDKMFKNGKFYEDAKKSTLDASMNFEADFFIGISLEPRVAILVNVITATMEAQVGVQIKANLLYSTDNHEVLEERHLCKSCIDGETLIVAKANFKVSILKKKNLTWEVLGVEYTKKLSDFYYSLDTKSFGYTSCPYKDYRQTIKVVNSNGVPISNATVNGVKTNSKGEVVLYLTKGEHSLSVVGGGVSKKFSVAITESSTYTFTLNIPTNNNVSSAFGNNVKASGKCGDNVYYKIYGTTLEINGSGYMYNYSGLAPWYDYRDDIEEVVIKKGVTSVGDSAFSSCYCLTSIKIPESVTSIGRYAFCYCSNLKSIILPTSVTSIDDGAFTLCESLTSITIPNSVTSIGDSAISCCYSLKSVTIPNTVTSIGYEMFFACSSLTSITIPNSVRSIGESAFEGCSNLKDVYYSGTASQWKAISIGSFNTYLTNATIYYNSSKSAVATTSADINSDVEIKPKKADIASVGAGTEQSYSREHLVAGSEALFVVVECSTDNFEITPDTLLYVGQTTVDENSCASVDVSQDFSSYNAVALIFGDCDHSASVWSMSVEPTFEVEGLNVCMCDYCENVIDTEDLTFLGDVDISGHIDIVDATYIQKFIALFDDINEPELMFADVSDDGVVSIMDATLIQMYLAELLTDSETV